MNNRLRDLEANTNTSADEAETDVSLVGRLVAGQFPQWADLPIQSVVSGGTDHAIYQLGDDLAVRLPRAHSATVQAPKERQWLPRLAPCLPLAIPSPLAEGIPAHGYPWHWSIYRWLPGQDATIETTINARDTATVLGDFVAALQRIDPTAGPPPGAHNFGRGVPLATRDVVTHAAIQALTGVVDTDAVTAAWDAALMAPAWQGPPVWLHGDLHAANLLVDRGRLSAVIDFGALAIGDPACDAMVAWTFLTASVRDCFRARLLPDEATWARGRGWALSFGLVALPYYQNTNRVLADIARHALAEVLADQDEP